MAPIFAWNVPLLSLIFLKRSLVFPSPLFSSISLHWSLRKAFLSLLLFFGTLHSDEYVFSFFLCLSLLFFSQLFVRPPQTTILPFFISSSWAWFWSPPPVKGHEPLTIVLQALCLQDLIPWSYLSLPLYNHKGFNLGLPEFFSGFSYFLQVKPEFYSKEFMIWVTVSSWFCFCWLYRVSPTLAIKI